MAAVTPVHDTASPPVSELIASTVTAAASSSQMAAASRPGMVVRLRSRVAMPTSVIGK